MKKQNKKSLSLDTKTIRTLDGAPLAQVGGGLDSNVYIQCHSALCWKQG